MDEKLFVSRLLDSQVVAARAVLHLRLKGLMVFDLARPSDFGVGGEVRARDDGDLLVYYREALQRVEVKCRSKWTDGGFPYDTVFLGETHQYRDSVFPLLGIMVVNAVQTHYLWVDASTREQWQEVEVFDPYYQRETLSYACPVELARFHKLLQ